MSENKERNEQKKGEQTEKVPPLLVNQKVSGAIDLIIGIIVLMVAAMLFMMHLKVAGCIAVIAGAIMTYLAARNIWKKEKRR